MTIHLIAPPPRPLNLGFLTPHNPYDLQTFSGTPHFAMQALQARPDIRLHVLGGHRPPGRLDRVLRRKPVPIDIDRLDLDGLDLVLSLVASSLLDQLLARRPDLPVLHVTDATPRFLRESYGWSIPKSADSREARVARGSAQVIYSSRQIAERAAADLHLPGLSSEVLAFGVNFSSLPDSAPEKPPLTKLNLLFVGLDWERKGGDVAVMALKQLRDAGRDAQLTVVGRCPERHRADPAITDMGFLTKNRPRDARRLAALYKAAHLLLLPTRADCTPMVVAEAMAHGTPVLATDTGGIAEQIGDAAGRVLPPFSEPTEWARAILQMTGDEDRYRFLSDAAFERAETHLSWSRWAAGIEGHARRVLARGDRDLKVAFSA